MNARRLFRAMPYLVLGVVLPAFCLSMPPFHTLTHEFTTLFTALSLGLFYFLSANRCRRVAALEDGSSRLTIRSEAILRSGLYASLTAGAALGVLAIANWAVFECRISSGLPYFLATWAPAVGFAIVAGASLGALALRNRTIAAIFVFAVILTAIHDGLQLYFGPRVSPVDFFLGDLAAFSQRSGMEPSALHYRQRAFLLLAAFIVLELGRIPLLRSIRGGDEADTRRLRRQSLQRLAAAAGSALFIVAFFGSYVGAGIGRANVHRVCNLVTSTEHFDFYHSDDPELLKSLDKIKRDCEWNWHYLSGLWNHTPEGRVRLYLFESPGDLRRFTGIESAHAGLGEMFSDHKAATSSTLLHELIHALHRTLKPTPFILRIRGMLEGTAMAFEYPYSVLPEAHEFQAAALKAGKLPSPVSFMSPAGFSDNAEGAAYESAGSFVGFLVYEYGFESFLSLQRTLDYERAFGKTIEDLDVEWRAFLAKVPVGSDVLLNATRFFDPGIYRPYYAEHCPKLGKDAGLLEGEAKRAWDLGDYADALELYSRLFARDNTLEWARWAARSLDAQDKTAEALALLNTHVEDLDLKDFERAMVIGDRVQLLVKLRDWPRLYEVYDERAQLNLGIGPGNRMGEACLRNPETREEYGRLIMEENEVARYARWARLAEAWPDYDPIQFLYAVAGIPPGAPLAQRADALIAVAGRSAELADMAGRQLRDLFDKALKDREYAIAERLCNALAKRCANARYRYAGEIGLRRIEFETKGR